MPVDDKKGEEVSARSWGWMWEARAVDFVLRMWRSIGGWVEASCAEEPVGELIVYSRTSI